MYTIHRVSVIPYSLKVLGILGQLLGTGKARGIHIPEKGGGGEPPIAQVQLSGHLAVTSSYDVQHHLPKPHWSIVKQTDDIPRNVLADPEEMCLRIRPVTGSLDVFYTEDCLPEDLVISRHALGILLVFFNLIFIPPYLRQ